MRRRKWHLKLDVCPGDVCSVAGERSGALPLDATVSGVAGARKWRPKWDTQAPVAGDAVAAQLFAHGPSNLVNWKLSHIVSKSHWRCGAHGRALTSTGAARLTPKWWTQAMIYSLVAST